MTWTVYLFGLLATSVVALIALMAIMIESWFTKKGKTRTVRLAAIILAVVVLWPLALLAVIVLMAIDGIRHLLKLQ